MTARAGLMYASLAALAAAVALAAPEGGSGQSGGPRSVPEPVLGTADSETC